MLKIEASGSLNTLACHIITLLPDISDLFLDGSPDGTVMIGGNLNNMPSGEPSRNRSDMSGNNVIM